MSHRHDTIPRASAPQQGAKRRGFLLAAIAAVALVLAAATVQVERVDIFKRQIDFRIVI